MNVSNYIRVTAALAAAAIVTTGAVLIAGCGDDDSTASSASPAPTNTAAATAPATTAPTTAGVAKAGTLEISNLRARTTTNDVDAVYFTVKNTGATADRLISAKVDPAFAGMAQVHETVTKDGTSAMQELKDGLPIPANGMVELKPGGYHIMIMNVKKPVAAGDVVSVELLFEKAGTVSIKPVAQEIQGAGGNMGNMGGGSSGGMGKPASPTVAH